MTLRPGRAGKASGSFSRCLLRLPPLITGGVHGAAEPMNNSSLSFPAPKRRDLCRSSRGMKAPAGSGEGPGGRGCQTLSQLAEPWNSCPDSTRGPAPLRVSRLEKFPFSQGFGQTEPPTDGFWGSVPERGWVGSAGAVLDARHRPCSKIQF